MTSTGMKYYETYADDDNIKLTYLVPKVVY
jgi:hypothetical protein